MTPLLREMLGSHTRVETAHTMLHRQDDAVVARLVRPALPVVVKLAGPRATLAAPFDRTAALIRLVRKTTAVPTPVVMAADVSYRIWPWRYLVTAYERGQTLAALRLQLTPEDVGMVHRKLGEMMAELHSRPFPAFGDVGRDGAINNPDAYPVALLARAERHREIFATVLAARAGAFAAVRQATLAHEDLTPTNIILKEDGGRWQLSATVDFDSAWAGSPASDLARMELWRGMASQAFWDG